MSVIQKQLTTGTRTQRALLLTFLSCIPLAAWWQSVGDPWIYIANELPEGQVHYAFSKLIGLYAIFLLWLQIVLALAKGCQFGRFLPVLSLKAHILLGTCTLLAACIHAGLFTWGVSLRAGHFAGHLLLPNLFTGYYNLAVSLGVFGLWLSFLVVLSGRYRKSSRHPFWGWLHKASLLTFLCIFVHGFMIGTESTSGAMVAFYYGMALTLLFVSIRRFQVWLASSGKRLLARSAGVPL